MTPERAQEILNSINFEVIKEGESSWSPAHRRYDCSLQVPNAKGASIVVPYQCNPEFTDVNVVSVMEAIVTDALIIDGTTLGEYLDEFYEPPASHAEMIDGYNSAVKGTEFLKEVAPELGRYSTNLDEVESFRTILEENYPDLVEGVAEHKEKVAAQEAFDHPNVPEGYQTVESLLSEMQREYDLSDVSLEVAHEFGRSPDSDFDDLVSNIADNNVDLYNGVLLEWLGENDYWLEEAAAEGLTEGCKGDLFKMAQVAQYTCFEREAFDKSDDIVRVAILEYLKEDGVYAVGEDLQDFISGYDSRFTGTYFVNDLEEALTDAAENGVPVLSIEQAREYDKTGELPAREDEEPSHAAEKEFSLESEAADMREAAEALGSEGKDEQDVDRDVPDAR